VGVDKKTGKVIASSGLVIHSIPPGPNNLIGKEGYIMSMYTHPEWRNKGVATKLMKCMFDFLRYQNIPIVSLHYTDIGKSVYESLGFTVSNEMKMKL